MNKTQFNPAYVSERFLKYFALLQLAISIIVLIGWISGLMFLTRFTINEVPMAPSTACFFFIISIGLLSYNRIHAIRIYRYFIIFPAIIVIGLSGLFLYFRITGVYTEWEQLFFTIPQSHTTFKIGYMSPVTAIVIILSGFSIIFSNSNKTSLKNFSIILMLGLLLCNILFLMGYAFNVPFFYIGKFIPPATLTVISFIIILFGFFSASDKEIFLIKKILHTSTSAKLLRNFLPIILIMIFLDDLIKIRILPLLNINLAVGVFISELFFIIAISFIYLKISQNSGKSFDLLTKDLRKSEKKFHNLFKNSSAGISMTSIDSYLDVNRKFCEITGYSKDEITGKHWREITHPDDIEKTNEFVLAILDGKLDEIRFKKRYIHKDGSTIWTDIFSFPQYDENGKPEYLITSIFDITDHKKIEENQKQHLLESEQNRRILLSLLSDQQEIEKSLLENKLFLNETQHLAKIGGWQYDVQNNTLILTEEVFNIYGTKITTPEEGIKFYHPDDIDTISNAFSKALEEKPYDVELRFINAHGENLWVRTMGNPVSENGKVVKIQGTIIDITERKEAENKIKNQLEELQRWNNATLGRETRIIELKGEINELLAREGSEPRYTSVAVGESNNKSLPGNQGRKAGKDIHVENKILKQGD